MTESETAMSDLMDDLDLEKTYDTGYEEDIEVEIIKMWRLSCENPNIH